MRDADGALDGFDVGAALALDDAPDVGPAIEGGDAGGAEDEGGEDGEAVGVDAL